MKLDIQFFASVGISTTTKKEYIKKSTSKLVEQVKVIVTPTPNEDITAEDYENNYQVALTGWIKCNDGSGSYYKNYTSNETETLTFQWTNIETPSTYLSAEVEINVNEIGKYIYEPVNWENGEEGRTALNKTNLRNMDDGINYLFTEGAASKDIYIGAEEEAPEDTKLLIETDILASSGTEVVNSLSGNETYKAPSVNTINKLITYSEEEQVIGYWENTDGTKQPLYRKKINTTTPSATGTTYDIATLPDECRIKLFDGYVSDGGQTLPLNFFITTDNCYYSYPYSNVYKMKLTNTNRVDKTCVLILDYTKTTDSVATTSLEDEGGNE